MTTIGQSETFDPLLNAYKKTFFQAVLNTKDKSKSGHWERVTEHQTHGLRFRLTTKKDRNGRDKLAIEVTVYERVHRAPDKPDIVMEKKFDLVELTHQLLGITEDTPPPWLAETDNEPSSGPVDSDGRPLMVPEGASAPFDPDAEFMCECAKCGTMIPTGAKCFYCTRSGT